MMKILCAAIILAVILAVTASSCGIQQEQYDSTVANLTREREELTSLNGTYLALSTTLEALTANLTDHSTQITTLSQELETAEEDHTRLATSFNATRSIYFEKRNLLNDTRSETESLEWRIPCLEYEVYESDDTAFTMDYPSDWKAALHLQNGGAGMVFLTNNAASSIILFGPSDEMASQEMYDMMIEGFEISGYDYSFITEYPVTVSGQEAVSGLLVVDETGIEMAFYQMISVENEYTSSIIIFGCLWSEYPRYSHTFGEMLDSFYLNPDYVYSFSWR